MGRKPLDEEQKRQQICARFSPAERDAIHQRADQHGRTPNAEVELLATQFLDLDDKTTSLFRAMADQIKGFGYVQKGKAWHETAPKWAAVRELLYNGVIEAFRPESWSDDEDVTEAFAGYLAIKAKRKALVDELRDMGLPALEEPHKPKVGRGLFGSLTAEQGRASLRLIAKGADDEEGRDTALRMIDQLEQLDRDAEAAIAKWQELRVPYTEAEAEGVAAARDHLQSQAVRDMAEGRPFNTHHLIGGWK